MPYIAGLPMPHAFAPSASALTTSLPRRMPPSSQTSSFDRRPASVSMEMISGSASIDDRAVSMLRPPWFDTRIAATPALAAKTASSPHWTPLSTIGIVVFEQNHATSFQLSAGSRFA